MDVHTGRCVCVCVCITQLGREHRSCRPRLLWGVTPSVGEDWTQTCAFSAETSREQFFGELKTSAMRLFPFPHSYRKL